MTKGRRRRSSKPNKMGPVGGHDGGKPAGGKTKKRSSSGFAGFLKKRAPIYLGILALFLVFVIPELTKSDLGDLLPELSGEDGRVVGILLGYDGGDGTGLSVMDSLSDKITGEFGDDVYGDDDTGVTIIVSPATSPSEDGAIVPVEVGTDEIYDVYFELESRKGTLNYTWTVDVGSGSITGNDAASKHVIDIVRFYD